MFANDILKVFYAPHKVFKEVIQNPKYWGPLLVFIIVVAAQSAFFYAQSEKIYYEQTYPGPDQLGLWSTNTTLWTTSPAIAISNNYIDYLNSTYYGNGSLQFAASNSASFFLALPNLGNADCSPTGYQNLSMRIKQTELQTAPTKVILTLYSLGDANTFQYDLTGAFSNASLVDSWNNITVPVGANAAGWQSNGGSPVWANITGLRLDFSFASNAPVTLRMEGLFFRGLYRTFSQISTAGLAITILQQALFQYVFEWLFLTGIIFIIIKGLKGTVTWKPIFIAMGLVLIVTAVQAVINLVATTTLSMIYSPIELQTQLVGEATAISTSIAAQTETYTLITGIAQLLMYTWIVALGTFVIRALQPEFTVAKSILTSAAALIVTIILMSLLGV
jgi:hypothetical protein